ncbi:FkbM family methyltransferase [Oceaniglobus ichthyenteri]|uniref:FkbM family methyltransferase n=1 Tax=Oceaniglobus ichthyenteri TaxID=2136177 RepID=UPI000D3784BE|nr:FkbM family methyltransferase [Oceaniglobus ichthyenteri]
MAANLSLRHRIATSALSHPVGAARAMLNRLRGVQRPELGLLRAEDAMMDAVLGRLVKPDFRCLDIGAHVGSVTYKLASLARRGSVTVIEASPTKAAMLRKRFPDHTVHEVAVSDTAGQVTFFENADAPGYSSLTNRSVRGAVTEINVKSVRLDDLFPDTDFDFIKIDVEGHEFAALSAASGMIARCHPIILFEAGAHDDVDISPESYIKLFRLLTETFDYDVRAVFDVYYGRAPIDLTAFVSYRTYPFLAFNYIAQPKAVQQ